jgi:hypothetical protein
MRFSALAFFFACGLNTFAQKPCDYSVNVVDSLGEYRVTKDYLVYEKVFAGNSSYLFNSIAVSDGIPTLNVQFIEKSFAFIKTKCFDKNSKIYLQLENGKIVTLIHIDKESCGTMVRDENGMNNRLMTGYFLFKKDDFQNLKNAPISYIRVKFSTETTDYIFKKNLNAELDGKTYAPANYFIDYFHCIEDTN